jgi:hypothetical protein
MTAWSDTSLIRRVIGIDVQAERALLITAYAAFNARDIDAVLALMQPNVTSPNGMEGGYVSAMKACAIIGRGSGR